MCFQGCVYEVLVLVLVLAHYWTWVSYMEWNTRIYTLENEL